MFQGPQPVWRFRKALADLNQPPATLLEATARVATVNITMFNIEDIYGLPPDLAQVLVQHLIAQKRLNYYTLSLFKTQFLYTLDLSGCNEVSNEWLALVINSPLQSLNLEGCHQVNILCSHAQLGKGAWLSTLKHPSLIEMENMVEEASCSARPQSISNARFHCTLMYRALRTG